MSYQDAKFPKPLTWTKNLYLGVNFLGPTYLYSSCRSKWGFLT